MGGGNQKQTAYQSEYPIPGFAPRQPNPKAEQAPGQQNRARVESALQRSRCQSVPKSLRPETPSLIFETVAIGRVLRLSIQSALDPPPASLDALLKDFSRQLLETSGCGEAERRTLLETFWSPPILAKQKLRELLLYMLSSSQPAAVTRPSVLVLYEVDFLVGSPFQHDVLNMLRAWQDDRFLAALRMVLASSITPRLLPVGGQSSLWTKLQRVDVSHVGVDQLRRLAELHGVAASDSACARLGDLVGWHIHLCRVAFFHCALYGLSLDGTLGDYQLGQHRRGAFSDHLEDMRHQLARLDASGSLPTPIGALLRAAPHALSLPPPAAWRLLRKGLICEAEVSNQFRLRCPLYANHFGACSPEVVGSESPPSAG